MHIGANQIAPSSHQGNDGFSLLEMLVALAIVSLMGTLMSGFLIQLKHVDRQSGMLVRTQSLDNALDYVSKTLKGAVRLPFERNSEGLGTFIHGTALELTFVAPTRIDSRTYALRRIQVGLAGSGESRSLVQVAEALTSESGRSTATSGEARAILDRVGDLRFSYLGADSEWSSLWNRPGELPRAIRIELEWINGGMTQRRNAHVALVNRD